MLNQTGQAVEVILITMCVYLTHQPDHVGLHELVQRAHGAGGAVSSRWSPDTDVAAPRRARRPGRPSARSAGCAHNLFSSWGNTLLTLIGLFIAYQVVAGVVSWGILTAIFTGADGSACTREGAGACWPFITAKFAQFMYGRYPMPERWRVDLVYVLALAGLVPLMIPRVPGKFWNAVYVFAIFPVIAFFLLVGGVFGLPHVDTELWGGLLVTLVVATVGITGSFPLGILLALGRRSNMPIVRWVSVGFIEFVRGVPLITVLFMASVMLPLFLPPGRHLRQAAARADRRRPVRRRLPGRDHPRRPAGDPARPVRGGRGARPLLRARRWG